MNLPAGTILACADSPTCHFGYRLAGVLITSDREFHDLSHFAEVVDPTPTPVRPELDWTASTVTFNGKAELARRTWQVECRALEQSYRIDVDGLCSLQIDRSGTVWMLKNSPDADPEDLALTAISPGLALSWPEHGRWLLHASGFALKDGRQVALLGRSGHGKSTLAAAFGEQRIADDCLAVDYRTARIAGRFPQPKLSDYGASCTGSGRVFAVVVLCPDDHAGPIELTPLGDAEALTTLARHTMAAALLAPDVLATHLADCRALSEQVQCYRLRYRQTSDQIPDMIEALSSL